MIAEVRLWDMVVGHLSLDQNRMSSIFRFHSDFVKKGLDIAPIIMPLNSIDISKTHSFVPENEADYRTFKGLPEFIADSLPDSFGNKVINAWLVKQGREANDFTSIERLCYTGQRGVGALEYFPLLGGEEHIVDVNIDDLVQLANEVLDKRRSLNINISQGDEALRNIVRVGASAGGARPKAVIAYNPATGDIKSGQIAEIPEGFEHWLIKLDGVSNSEELGLSSGMGRVEYAYHQMAKDCNIEMSDCRLLEERGRAHFMTRRFDRSGKEKIFMQSLNAIAHMNYNQIDTHYYEQFFSTIREMRLPHSAIEQQYRRMVFNVVAKNCDDHTKNVSFLMDRNGRWSLSPAYDVSYAYDPSGFWNRRHLMGINGKFENFSMDDMEKVGVAEGIRNRKRIIEEICDVVNRWPEYAQSAGIEKSLYKKIGSVHEMHINMKKKKNVA